MERDANYVAVGAFVLLLIAMGVWFLLWYADAGDRREYNTYEINFTGSVGGLDQGSAVRYLGVDVGRVRRLALDRNNPSQVKVFVEIDENAPISGATRANLNMQGITGLLFINLKQASDGDPTAPLPQGERYPVIQAVTSELDDLIASLPDLVSRASQLLERIETQVFSRDNTAALTQTLTNIRDTTKGMPKTAEKIADLTDQLRVTLEEVNGAAASIRGITEDSRPEITQAIAQFKVTAENLSAATKRVNDFVASAEVQMGHLSEHGLFEFERLLRDARDAANEFGDLSRSLKQQPSQLMYEKPNTGTEIKP